MCRGYPAVIVACLLTLFVALPAAAAEEILSFDSVIEVQPDGAYLVTETIRVRAEGQNIRRGIYRDIPTTFEDADGRIANVGFELLSATRDGASETTRIETSGSFLRIYFGRQEVFLDHGVHTYAFTYRTDRQVRLFPDHDEIYWNVTGTEWVFPILSASAEVRLPETGAAIDAEAYTGAFGSREQKATWSISSDRRSARFDTTAPLGSREGLTVYVGLRKGVIPEPTAAQILAWFLRDNLGAIIAAAGTALVLIYYVYAWMAVGRDLPRGVVVPRWDLPDGVSPALTHYVWNKGLRRQGFPALSAAAVQLAVQGYLEFDEIGDTITLKRTAKSTEGKRFPVGEQALLDRLPNSDSSLRLSKSSGERVSALGAAFRRAMESEHRNVFYRSNTLWVVLGFVLSVATVVITLIFGSPDPGVLGLVVPMTFVGIVLTIMAVNIGKAAGTGLAGKIQLVVFGFFIVSSLVNAGFFAISQMWDAVEQPVLIGTLVTLVLINVLFFFLMGAPTPLGRQRTDEIAGLKQYLSVAEKDRMNMAGAPEMSPAHYEKLLPYAMALGVEKPWTRAFDTWLATAVAAGAVAAGSYSPGWYHGNFGNRLTISDRIGDMTSSLSDSFTAALPTPKSSSSGSFGGGGFSGGGGGGGGGGGW